MTKSKKNIGNFNLKSDVTSTEKNGRYKLPAPKKMACINTMNNLQYDSSQFLSSFEQS
jgi:hypothetical protein